MRFLILNTDYPEFLGALYAAHPGLAEASFDEQLAVRNASLFGVADFYPRNLAALGHDAVELHINNRRLQGAWARAHGLALPQARLSWTWRRRVIPWLSRQEPDWMCAILAAQVEHYRPDVLLSHAIWEIPPAFWDQISKHFGLLVGQVASPLPDWTDLGPFDLMLSSLPNFIERFSSAGVRAALFRLAFDPVVLARLPEVADPSDPIDVSFVGSLSPEHEERIHTLEHLCQAVDVKIWAPSADGLPADSPIRTAYQGPAWGVKMFGILQRSRISLNQHIGISGQYANNMRLYEATGVGSLLLTDMKANLSDMFEVGSEVVAYNSPADCVGQVERYLTDEESRRAIAEAGQRRTLRDHTYASRMSELVRLVAPMLN